MSGSRLPCYHAIECAFTDFVLFGGRRAGTGVSTIRAWGIDLPSVGGSIAGVVEITSGSERSADCGLVRFDALRGMTEVAGGGLYAARPGFGKRAGCKSSYNPNAKPPATAR